MGLILWPAAVLVFLAWSFAAWLAYGLSDWAAGLIASASSGILSADLGPWAAWLLNSLGDIIQVAVVGVWAVVALLILATPIWLGRMRKSGRIPETYRTGDYRQASMAGHGGSSAALFGGGPQPRRYEHRRDDDDDDDDDDRRKRWQKSDTWKQRMHAGYGEMAYLRDTARHMVDDFRNKKFKKKKSWKWDD